MIDVTFSIISGTKQTLRLRDTTTVGEAKQTLSVIADSPPHTLTLLHKARILKDTDRISDLDFSNRNFIAVGIRRKSLMVQKHTGDINNNEDDISPLKAIFGDSFATVRRHFLENPASVPILIAYIARSDPVNARLLSESPQILLRFLGISPEEFIVAINNMTQRYQQDQNQSNQQVQNNDALNQNQSLPSQESNENNVESQNPQVENPVQPRNSDENQNNQNSNINEQSNTHQQHHTSSHENAQPSTATQAHNQNNLNIYENSILDLARNHRTLSQQPNSNNRNANNVISLPSQQTNSTNNINDNAVNEANSHPSTRSNDIDIAAFLATMTSEDLSNLEIVLSTNVSLEEAIPVFLQTGKNVDATINALRKAGSI